MHRDVVAGQEFLACIMIWISDGFRVVAQVLVLTDARWRSDYLRRRR